ncbi:DUF4160 domain-containing protein [Laspinema sp. D1]|uniref:DUF4160 domain-containing protein n=1 Tax=Laspinema palackyanum TaxID=3231601 RepID=UPI00347CA625|nr:DUF4160 domain-containing protein [Laspinema sp. D2b]
MERIARQGKTNPVIMPTVLKKDGFDFRIYFNDHSPPHVHVFKAGGQAKISLTEGPGGLEILGVDSLSNKDVKRALEIVIENQQELANKWEEIYG